MQMGQRGATMNIGQLDGQPLALQIFNGMTAESTCVNERWAKDQLFRCVCFAGERHQTILDETVGPIFQSTSSVWRTTTWNNQKKKGHPHFNPRPPCGGRRFLYCVLRDCPLFQSTSSVWRTTLTDGAQTKGTKISIHVLRVEDDPDGPCHPVGGEQFQSTSSVWRTTLAAAAT